MFASFLTTVLFSVSALCAHRSAKLIGGTEANFWRISVATFFLAIWAYGFGKGLSGAALPIFLLSGVVGIGFGDVAYFQALPRLGPRLSLLLVQCLTAPIGAIIEWLWLGASLTPWQILFGVVVLAGVAIALAPEEHLHISPREWTLGILAGSLAALGQAGGAVLSRKAYEVVRAHGEHIDGINAGFQRVVGGLVLAGICLAVVKRRERRLELFGAEPELQRRAAFWIVLNSLAGQTLGVSCMQWALETTKTGIVLPIIATAPIVVIPLAWLIDG